MSDVKVSQLASKTQQRKTKSVWGREEALSPPEETKLGKRIAELAVTVLGQKERPHADDAAGRNYSGADRARGEQGGESKESAATGLHCTQGAIRTPSQENRAGENLDPIIIIPFALHGNADAKSTVRALRNIGKMRTKDHRTIGSKFPPRDGASSFSEGLRRQSLGSELHRSGVRPSRNTRNKFVPWDTEGSRKLLQGASGCISNTTECQACG